MASIHDVARVSGVSISTVSYALSGKRPVSEATRARIAKAAKELGYQPNARGRMLAGRRTQLLALTAPLHAETSAPAHMAFVLAVVTAARRYDYDVILLTEEEATGGLSRVTSSKLADGIVVLDVAIDDHRVDLIRDLDIPAVLIGVPGNTAGLVCVDLDFEAAARLAVDQLADNGHTSLALLGEPHAVYERGSNYPRRFRDALLTHAAARSVDCIFVESSKNPVDVRAAIDTALAAEPRPTGLVMQCAEPSQVTTLEHLAARGVRIPAELSVISAASTFDTSRFTPPLDVIPLVPAETSDRAIDLLMTTFSKRHEPVVELLAPRYFANGSVGPPPARSIPRPHTN
ncbi:LacI family DNA-binding transcriptional regulator [Phytoactinopolyspora mesophila]|uniref:LacI family DNA-binding transcriptional regulator n=1 Tax=Phytoactinopolyspora mesophila TaxID=2650750 RepID=A0A7K3MDN1_9ACTN|nr:LacI family DNA-binding transcriptional regulator [Phytoactinopolyspora mesophila]NDL60518.1 LacI family DNA-binding transcriptional regulator [Phytoactinopolyspora mesophila]